MNIRTADAGRGAAWLFDGFGYFSKDAPIWLATVVILFVAWFVISLVPIIGGIVAQVLMFVVTGGLMLGCRAQEQGGKLELGHMVAGFNVAGGQLALIGVLYMVGVVVIVILMGVMIVLVIGASALSDLQSGDPALVARQLSAALLPALVGLALLMPLFMLVWFAPALVVFNGVGAIEAMKLSFMGCLRNVVPFLLYGIVGLILGLLASIPLMLGWLVLFPMLTASVYIAYSEIYQADAAAAV